jgi:hypothetical protein
MDVIWRTVALHSLRVQAVAMLPFFTLGEDVEQTDCYAQGKNWDSRKGVAEDTFLLGRDIGSIIG